MEAFHWQIKSVSREETHKTLAEQTEPEELRMMRDTVDMKEREWRAISDFLNTRWKKFKAKQWSRPQLRKTTETEWKKKKTEKLRLGGFSQF